jgi:hypothetical protein
VPKTVIITNRDFAELHSVQSIQSTHDFRYITGKVHAGLGALIGSNAQNNADRAAAVSIATQAIAGCAESAPLIAKYGRRLQSRRSRLN